MLLRWQEVKSLTEKTKCRAVKMEVKKQDLKRMAHRVVPKAKANALALDTKAVANQTKAKVLTTKINQT